MAKQKQKIYKENSLEEITVRKVICVCVCICVVVYVTLSKVNLTVMATIIQASTSYERWSKI